MRKMFVILAVSVLLITIFIGCEEKAITVEEGATKCVNGDLYTYVGNQWVLTEKDCQDCNETINDPNNEVVERNETGEKNEPIEPDESLDSDNDNLDDALEMRIGTDPYDSNTDGDRYNDYMEYTGENMPAYVKGKGASPLYPAVPEIDIIPDNEYEIILAEEIYEETEHTQSQQLTIKSNYYDSTNTISGSYLEVGTGNIMTSLLTGGLPISINAGVYHTNQQTTIINSENIDTTTEQIKWLEANNIDLKNSYIRFVINIKNVGTDILQSQIDDIIINLYIGNDIKPSLNDWSLAENHYNLRNIKPGESLPITAEFYGLTTEKLSRIYTGEGIRIVISHYSFGEDELYLLDSLNRLIKVTIDDGDSVVNDYVRCDEASTFLDIISSITIIEIDNDVIQRVGTKSKTSNAGWFILTPNNEDIKTNSELLDAKFNPGDEIVLIYMKDSDNDNIYDKDEIVLGLNPESTDTDNDGISDYDELNEKYGPTNPRFSDTDFDGLLDGEEIISNSYGCITNPVNQDSDADGVNDGKEVENLTNPCASDTDNDGLLDGEELNIYHTIATDSDTDDDSLIDGDEILLNQSGFDFNPNTKNELFLELYPSDDSHINKIENVENYGNNQLIEVRNYWGSFWESERDEFEINGLFKFDFTVIPIDLEVISAELNLYYYDYDFVNPRGRHLGIYRITENWNEDTITWNNSPDYNNDFTSDSIIPSSPSKEMSWDVTEDVKDFFNGLEQNYGWLIKDYERFGDMNIPITKFSSKETLIGNNYKPSLFIEIRPL